MITNNDFVKSPDAALRFIPPLLSQGQACCDVRQSTPHSSGFARLDAACSGESRGPFYEAVYNDKKMKAADVGESGGTTAVSARGQRGRS